MNIRRTLWMVALLALVVAPAQGQGTLFVEGDNVGIGTDDPKAALHAVRTTGGVQQMLQLAANGTNGRPRFVFSNPSGTWFYEVNGNNFEINRSGSGGNDELVLQPDGDMIIGGTLTELSTRTAKQGFTALDPVDVLNRLVELPVLSWTYTRDEAQSRHIGPMAEDFYAAFALGEDNRHISPSDKAGVALLAIQGLQQQVEQLTHDKKVLEERLSKLEQLLQ